MGRSEKEHDINLEATINRLKEYGLTVNKDKCVFKQPEIVFYGLKLSSSGISLNDSKIQALKDFKTPNNSSELHSFLGLSVYASRWIKNLASLSAPLWKLTHKGQRWKWTNVEQELLDKIKSSLIDTVGYYDKNWNTQLTVDASDKGLFMVLTQLNPSNDDEKKLGKIKLQIKNITYQS